MLFDTFLPALMIFLVVVAGMAVGVIFSNRRISGSCGGLSAIPGTDHCGICGRDLREASSDVCERTKSG